MMLGKNRQITGACTGRASRSGEAQSRWAEKSIALTEETLP